MNLALRGTAALVCLLLSSPGLQRETAGLAKHGDFPGMQSSRLATLHWNAVARTLVARNRVDPLWAVRTFALLSIAQNDALFPVKPLSTYVRNDDAGILSEQAAVATASATILGNLFPNEVPYLADALQAHLDALTTAGVSADQLQAESEFGRVTARRILRRRNDDGSDNLSAVANTPTVPSWISSRRSSIRYPLRPFWGSVRPLVLARGSEFIPSPPPPVGSPAFEHALREVRQISDTRTVDQLHLARYWDDGAGTATPAGHWNLLAAELITQHGLTDRESARTLALLNVAMMDASIACWNAKYTYWLLRPNQADSGIVPIITLPNFPSYPSGHAVFSGAASEVLVSRFPADADAVNRMAEDAAMSRIFGGIHYRFDIEAGLRLGRSVANLVLETTRGPGPLLDRLS
jgi:hypothetical protein